MKLELSDKEVYMLAKLASLGNWMLSSYKAQPSKSDDECNDLEGKIVGYLKDTKYKNIVQVSPAGETFYNNQKFEEELYPLIEKYNDKNFLEMLSGILAANQMELELGTQAVEAMSNDDYLEQEYNFKEKVLKILSKKGFSSLSV